jgi:magnesium transporter
MLVNCVAYKNGSKLADIKTDEIRDYVNRPECFVWVGLRDADDAELQALEQQFDLHPLAVEDARHGHQRPKVEEYGRSLFAVLHLIEHSGDGLRVGELDIFAGANYVLSARRDAEFGFQAVRTRCEGEPELLQHGSGYVLYALMDAVVDRYPPILHDLRAELEAIEAEIFSDTGQPRAVIEALYGLKQKLTVLKHAVEPLLEVLGKLFGGRVPPVCLGMDDYFRDIYDHLVRLNQSIDSAQDLVTTAMSVNLSLVTIRDNEITKRLAANAALVAVPTLVAGIYGMNFDHMPELRWELGYPLVVGVMAMIDAYLFYRFRKAGWL